LDIKETKYSSYSNYDLTIYIENELSDPKLISEMTVNEIRSAIQNEERFYTECMDKF